ncbi:MAG: GNAT family N-acetyltransferase [Pseudomonadota bacterium]
MTTFNRKLNPALADISFIPFTEAHLDAGLNLSTAAGWAHRREDWEMLLPFSKGVVAVHAGGVVGTGFRADFGEVSTVTMIIVSREMRSRGLGRALTTAAIGETDQSLRLVATVSGMPLYQKLGFETVGTITCLQGVVETVGDAGAATTATADDMPAIASLESESFGGDRAALVGWMETHARFAVIRDAGCARAYAACRPFGVGHVIGPIVAPSLEDAQALVAYLARDLVGQVLRLDVAETSGLQPGLAAMGLTKSYPAPIMQRGPSAARQDRLAFASQALV